MNDFTQDLIFALSIVICFQLFYKVINWFEKI